MQNVSNNWNDIQIKGVLYNKSAVPQLIGYLCNKIKFSYILLNLRLETTFKIKLLCPIALVYYMSWRMI